jgi:hypothetical protein
MKRDTIYINDTAYRVEINMNTAENWEQLSGKKLGQFEIEAAEAAKKGGVATRAMLLWLFCAIKEGEELDGKGFELDFLEFKRMLSPSVMSQFASIFIKQYIGNDYIEKVKQDTDGLKKKTKICLRLVRFVKSPWVKWAGALLILSFAVLLFIGRLFAV